MIKNNEIVNKKLNIIKNLYYNIMFYTALGDFIIKEDFVKIGPPAKTPGKTPSKTADKTPSKTPSKTPGNLPSKTPSKTTVIGPSNTITKFTCPTDKYNYEDAYFNFTEDLKNNFETDIDCLVLPGRVWNGEGKRNFIVTMADPGCTEVNCNATGNHGYEIFLMNPNPENTIFVNIIKPNFFCIVNTSYMQKNGKLKFQTSKNNEKLRFIVINNIKDNDEFIVNNDNIGNKCRDPDDEANPQRYDYSLEPDSEKLREVEYEGNPRIYVMGDYLPCDISKLDKVINVYIYFDYGLTPDKTNKCLGKLKLPRDFSDAVKGLYIKENHNGFVFDNYTARSIIIDFDPRDIVGRNGFITVINTKKDNDVNKDLPIGSVTYNDEIIQKLLKKIQCYYVRFWLANINFSSDTELAEVKSRKGPYKSISFTGKPKIIIYIPPHIFKPVPTTNVQKTTTPVTTIMTDDEINIRTEIYKNKNFQTSETSVLDVLDIYVSVIY